MSDIEERAEKSAAPFWTVAIYLVDQAYGGPEEGGWWYQCGERIDHVLDDVPNAMLMLVVSDFGGLTGELGASNFARIVQEKLDATVNVGRREISSVLSTGRYVAQVYNGHPPHHFPETRPHYD